MQNRHYSHRSNKMMGQYEIQWLCRHCLDLFAWENDLKYFEYRNNTFGKKKINRKKIMNTECLPVCKENGLSMITINQFVAIQVLIILFGIQESCIHDEWFDEYPQIALLLNFGWKAKMCAATIEVRIFPRLQLISIIFVEFTNGHQRHFI